MALSLSLCEWRRPHVLRVASSSSSRNGGGGRTDLGMGQGSRPGLTGLVHLGPVRSPLHPCGSSHHFALCPHQLCHFGDIILAPMIEGFLAWSSVFYTSILGGVPL
jgi:hypothetical protein